MNVTPYLDFDGRLDEALEFYKQAVGAKVGMVMRYSDSPDAPPPGMVKPGSQGKILHSSFTIGNSLVMATDGGCWEREKFGSFSLALEAKDAADAQRIFAALSDGAQAVTMPLGATFFSPCFGMLTDRFGLAWMVTVPGENPETCN